MIPSNAISSRSSLLKAALVALGSAFAFALVLTPAVRAVDASAPAALDDKGATLPVAYTFDKSTDPDAGPYVLNLKNTSDASIKVTGKVLLSVFFHADSKARNVPEHVIEAGQSWAISGLAANDKVILSAPGFAPLELTVP
ncbi:MAG TPA: hypothetical protein VII09_01125 [Opitutaceae bacterium]